MKILIAGAGVAGLTAALALERAGFEVHVFEAASAIAPLGLGVNLQPYAVRELTDLGVFPDLADRAAEIRHLDYINAHGQLVLRAPMGRAAGFDWAQYAIHRGVLQLELFDRAEAKLGAGAIRLGRRLTDFTIDGPRVRARFTGSGGEVETHEGDLLIGADGLHSAVRAGVAAEARASILRLQPVASGGSLSGARRRGRHDRRRAAGAASGGLSDRTGAKFRRTHADELDRRAV